MSNVYNSYQKITKNKSHPFWRWFWLSFLVISLTYAEVSKKEKNSTFLVPKGVFGLDVPLDKAHMYEYCIREISRNFSEVGVNEGTPRPS